ncbi:MAG: TonB family protein [Blastocatellia bacterium]|nr:TonB family protein [Blastocatellia bacterium]MDW8167163.1 TonB family protein [Acidobacteriota bacterium]
MRKRRGWETGAFIFLLVIAFGRGPAVSAQQEATTAEQDLQRGRVLFYQQNYSGAIEVLKQAIAKKPDLAEAHYFLGMSYYRLADYAQAEAALRTALKLKNENYPEAHFGMGMIHFRKREVDLAVREFQTAIEQRGGNYPDAFNVLGVIYYGQRRFADAIQSFRKAIEQRPEGPEVYFNLGMAIEQELVEGAGQQAASGLTWNDAISAYRKAIEQRGTYPLAQRALGLALIGVDNEAAITELGVYVQQVPQAQDRLQIEEIIDLLKKPDDPAAVAEELGKVPRVSKVVPVRLTEEAMRNKVQGSVVLSVLFCYDKRARVVKVVKGLGYGLDEAAIEAVRRVQFEPAVVGGRQVSERRLVKIEFKS